MNTHPRKLLVIIAEAALEAPLAADAERLGAHGYTVCDVRGAGARGARRGDWDADRSIRMEVICESTVAQAIADHVHATYFADYAIALYITDCAVLRPEKF